MTETEERAERAAKRQTSAERKEAEIMTSRKEATGPTEGWLMGCRSRYITQLYLPSTHAACIPAAPTAAPIPTSLIAAAIVVILYLKSTAVASCRR